MRIRSLHFLCAALLCTAFSATVVSANMCHDMPGEVGDGGMAGGHGSALWLQFTYQFLSMDAYKEGSTTRSLDDARAYVKPDGTTYTSLPISMDMMRYTLTAGYDFGHRFGHRFKALVSLPFVRTTMDMTVFRGVMLGWGETTMEPASGAGDATVLGLYRLYANEEMRPTMAFFLGLGVKVPTGSWDERTESGSLIHAHMQPGTGSWDPLVTALYTTVAGPFTLQADASYRAATRNRQGYEFGDSASVGLSGKYTLPHVLGISAGLVYRREGRAADRDGRYYDPATNSSLIDDPANTGGDGIWFSPGIQAFPMQNLTVDARVQLPLRQEMNGIQLVARSVMSAGISYRF